MQSKRQTLLTQLFSTTDRQVLESLIAEGATVQEGGKGSRKYSRAGELLQTLLLDQACAACCSAVCSGRMGVSLWRCCWASTQRCLLMLMYVVSVLHLEGLSASKAGDCLLPLSRSPEQSNEMPITSGCRVD